MTVCTVSDVEKLNKEFVVDLFSDDDQSRLSPADASFDRAACLSYRILNDTSITEETKKNFKEILEYLSVV